MSGETANFHARYLYRDYLQVAECDLTGETPVLVRSYLWDPSEPEATRVLAMTRWEANGTQVKEHLYCMHDAMKNVTSLFGEARGRPPPARAGRRRSRSTALRPPAHPLRCSASMRSCRSWR